MQATSSEHARQSLSSHVEEKGTQLFRKYGPNIGWNELVCVLEDRAFVRYPCTIVFDSAELQAGEFAHPVPLGEKPEDGFTMFVHPIFMTQLEVVPALVLYQLVLVNYGAFASPEEAEAFGAAALGISPEAYYAMVCAAADQLATPGTSCS